MRAEGWWRPSASTTGRDLRLHAKALLNVFRVHRVVRKNGFDRLRRYVKTPIDPSRRPSEADIQRICAAVQTACTLYFRRSTCVHRSAALVRLLRAAGGDAHLVFGVQGEPYGGHAWVEIGGNVISDDPSVLSRYTVVERM